MKIQTRKIRDVAVVSIEGRVTGEKGEQIRDVLKGFLASGTHKVVVDLGKTEWMSSAGIGALVGSHQEFEDVGAQIKLAGLTRRIKELITITRLTEVFDLHDTVEEALTAFTN